MSEHYFTAHPKSASDVRRIFYQTENHTYTFLTDHGVFSMQRIDPGTDLLIRTVLKEEDTARRILDPGCGYGPIGIVLAKEFGCQAVLMDINERAMDLARQGAVLNEVGSQIRVVTEDMLRLCDAFDLVVTNPPIRAGKQVVYHFFSMAYEELAPLGRLYVVMQNKQGAGSAVRELTRVFGNCTTVDRKSGYHILRAVKE